MLSEAEVSHFQDKGREVAYLFENKKAPGVGEFRRVEKAVINEGSVSSQIVKKASGEGEGEQYLLKFLHNISWCAYIKRQIQSFFFLVLSLILLVFRDTERARFYELKSHYYDNLAVLHYREMFANNVWPELLGKGEPSLFSSEVLYESQALEDGSVESLLPALTVKYIDQCKSFEKRTLFQEMGERSPYDFFEGEYHPAFIYYLRILVQLDEDALKLDNYLLQPVQEQSETGKPRYRCIPIDGGMCMYKGGSSLRKAKTVDELLAKLRKPSWKHYAQYSCRPTMLEILEKMEKDHPGYLRKSLVDVLERIANLEIGDLIDHAKDIDMEADTSPGAHEEFERIKALLEKQCALAKRLVESERERHQPPSEGSTTHSGGGV
ncbi:hypothetical protein [Kistimonas asteriae]|uniref:hypothetical protein n=1 Tax=Kistimonas asteriae TaxID=517724 RepID=UPI001BA71BC4|nr:hypothetical protein [Kistimonas asteriae]